MSINKYKENSWLVNDDTILLSYFKDQTDKVKAKEMHFCGFHKGEITGNNIEVKSYTKADDLMNFVESEKLIVSEEQANQIIENDEKNQKVKLTDEQKQRITNFVKAEKI